MLNVRKESGWTSHDVVARVRRLAGQKRVGHAGTLDPLAEGVLPVLLGRATRVADLIQAGEKEYRAIIALGTETATDDREGETTRTSAVPSLSDEEMRGALEQFEGEIDQVPPAYSAVKVRGRAAYAVARRGGTVELTARRVVIKHLELVAYVGEQIVVDITCSRGTYVRSLARDLGRALGTAAHLSSLVRTRVGAFRVEDGVTMEQLASDGVEVHLLPTDAGLEYLPRVDLGEADAQAVRHGRAVAFAGVETAAIRVYDESGSMLAIAAAHAETLRPRVVLLEDA